MLRQGILFRPLQHKNANVADLLAVAALGLKVVIDLRGNSERAHDPCPRAPGFVPKLVHCVGETVDMAPHLVAARQALDPEGARRQMLGIDRDLPFRPAVIEALALYFDALARTNGASLVHCLARKDRTGLAVALLHELLGVKRQQLLDDYLAPTS